MNTLPLMPFRNGAAIDLSSTDATVTTRAIYVGTGGDVKVVMKGADVTFKAVPGGTKLDIVVSKVYKTGTTASNLVSLS